MHEDNKMKTLKKFGKATNIPGALASLTSLLSNQLRMSRKRSLQMGAFLAALTLIPAAPALAAKECKQSNSDLYASKAPAVVLITALNINPYRTDDRIQLTTGSGFIFDDQGLIMTNSHVVFGARALNVTFNDGTTLSAKLLGADPIFDLAILQIPAPKTGKLPALSFGDSDAIRPGDKVVAIGNPMGMNLTITSGIVSAINRILPERPRMLSLPMIQTDTPINPGNSGGPILNGCGEVIGIASEILGHAQNIGFAIPSNLASSVVSQLVTKGRVIRPWFGVDGSLIDSSLRKIFALPLTDGFLVEAVEQNSPAAIAGITGGSLPVKIGLRAMVLGGDVIVAINDIPLKDGDSMQRALDLIQINSRVRLKVFRDGKTFDTEIKVTERPLQPGDVPESPQSFSVRDGQGNNNGKNH
jgi:S1-C subfamily serine protease